MVGDAPAARGNDDGIGAAGAGGTGAGGGDGGRGAGESEVDWFGYPLRPTGPAVPCPRCGEGFTRREALDAHLRQAHGLASGARPAAGARRDQPALGRNRRSRLSRRLRTIPLVLVVAVNVALIAAVLGGLAAVGPAWWDELMAQPWGQAVIVPLLWPTLLFLALRGVD